MFTHNLEHYTYKCNIRNTAYIPHHSWPGRNKNQIPRNKPGRGADHLIPATGGWECVWLHLHSPNTSSWRDAELSSEYVFMAWYLVKHGGNFTFTIRRRTFQQTPRCIYKMQYWRFRRNRHKPLRLLKHGACNLGSHR